MKKDLQILLNYLREYTTAFNVTDTNLKSEKQDAKMLADIQKIAKKHNLKF